MRIYNPDPPGLGSVEFGDMPDSSGSVAGPGPFSGPIQPYVGPLLFPSPPRLSFQDPTLDYLGTTERVLREDAASEALSRLHRENSKLRSENKALRRRLTEKAKAHTLNQKESEAQQEVLRSRVAELQQEIQNLREQLWAYQLPETDLYDWDDDSLPWSLSED